MKKIRLLTVMGVRINIHWTFLLLIAWILIMQAVSRASIGQTIWALIAIASIFTCVVLHELGHAQALAAGRYNETIGSLVTTTPEMLQGERTGDSIIDKLLLQDNAVYPVLYDNQLAGILSLDSIIEYLLIHDTQKRSKGHRASVTRLLHQA
ncbi:MAG TPA: hypothetical protein VIM87_17080 [Chitinophaga sp.]|uniref:hypothetical protein n=1 Tax=Chitinophaga sp. TaxID=1869181 RepID=UPI002F947188